MTDRSMAATVRRILTRLTSLERRLARTPRTPGDGQLASAGDVKMTARATAPTGWLLCRGQSLLRADYAELFAAIGTTYGAVDGTHFTLPNAQGRTIVGFDAGQTEFNAMGKTGGAKTHTLTVAEIPAHGHTQRYGTPFIAPSGGAAVGGMTSAGSTGAVASQQTTVDTGGGGAHNNLQPFLVLNYIIKA